MADAMPLFFLRAGTGVGCALAMAGDWGEHCVVVTEVSERSHLLDGRAADD